MMKGTTNIETDNPFWLCNPNDDNLRFIECYYTFNYIFNVMFNRFDIIVDK